jgi:hypothetical protein
MAKPRSAKFETATARLKHAVDKKPYTVVKLARGIFLEYRRNRGAGTWIVRAADGHGKYWTKRIGDAADFEKADNTVLFDYWAACERALVFARGTGDEAGTAAMVTLDQALTAYRKNLEALGGDPYNAERPRRRLPAKLLSRPVVILDESGAGELAAWRDGLLAGGLAPASARRLCACVQAACNLAAERDPRITNRSGWKNGLGGITDTTRARRVTIADEDVLRLIRAAATIDRPFGLLIAVIGTVGARLSQAARLRVMDLEAARPDCRLQMPSSRKGKRRKTTFAPVPIPRPLADMLERECEGCGAEEPLLRRSGSPWPYGYTHQLGVGVADGRRQIP